ncbi:RNA polymerase sigma factor [Amphibacillus sediminis]|uniref:RNA polymerase sigma factor n=1 Tax=Amphibacillus sediminis TaxID=360185 RepID=UPI0008374ED6|nr:RNA polymerase sigma factor [Amphibacillus sediminis]
MHATVEQAIPDFDTYFNDHYQEMYFVALRVVHNHYSAEDVVQEAYLKAYKNYTYLTDASKRRAWLRTIVIRTAIDLYRKETKYPCLSLEEETEAGREHCYTGNSVEDQFERILEYEQVEQAINTLPKSLREVLQLKLIHDSKDKVIANELNISLAAVKTRLHRARKQLKEIYSA